MVEFILFLQKLAAFADILIDLFELLNTIANDIANAIHWFVQ